MSEFTSGVRDDRHDHQTVKNMCCNHLTPQFEEAEELQVICGHYCRNADIAIDHSHRSRPVYQCLKHVSALDLHKLFGLSAICGGQQNKKVVAMGGHICPDWLRCRCCQPHHECDQPTHGGGGLQKEGRGAVTAAHARTGTA